MSRDDARHTTETSDKVVSALKTRKAGLPPSTCASEGAQARMAAIRVMTADTLFEEMGRVSIRGYDEVIRRVVCINHESALELASRRLSEAAFVSSRLAHRDIAGVERLVYDAPPKIFARGERDGVKNPQNDSNCNSSLSQSL